MWPTAERKNMTTLAFDIYGTLVDTQAMTARLEPLIGEKASAFANSWRLKQLEYTFRRTVMNAYRDFDLCTAQALQYCCDAFALDISETQQQALLEAHRHLPAYPETRKVLSKLDQRPELACHAFSNGVQKSVETVLLHNDLRQFLGHIVSADAVGHFKPHRTVYQHFEQQTATLAADCLVVSANPFDVTGALAAGWRAIWLQRDQNVVFDPWEYTPTAVVHSLEALCDLPALSVKR